MSQPQAGAGGFTVVPPGPVNGRKRHMLAKFMQENPGFAASTAQTWRLAPDKSADARSQSRRPGPAVKPPPPLLLEKFAVPGEVIQRGVPEGGAALGAPQAPSASSVYYLFVKAGKNTIVAYPVDLIYSFKPPPKQRGTTLEDAEARMRQDRASADSMGSFKLVPKSMRIAAEKLAEEAGPGAGGKALLSAEAALAKLFGETPGGIGDGDDGLDIAGPGKKGKRSGGAGRGRGRGRAVRGADGAELDADEVAEDIYEGLGGEGGGALRPSKPEPAEDWEHQEDHADDDLSQGEGGSDLDDDPGERIKLGLEGGSDEEEGKEEEDEAAKKLKKKLAEEEGEEEDGADQGDGGTQDMSLQDGSGGGGMMDDDDNDDMDLDDMAMQAAGPVAGAAGPSGTAVGTKRKAEASTPPPAPAPAAAGKRPAPPAAAPVDPAAKRARTSLNGTPPAPAIKTEVKTEPGVRVGAAGAAAAAPGAKPVVKQEAGGASKPTAPTAKPTAPTAKPAAPTAQVAGAAGAAALTAPSVNEIRQAVVAAGGKMPLNSLRQLFMARISGKRIEVFKKNIGEAVKLVKDTDGSQVLVLK